MRIIELEIFTKAGKFKKVIEQFNIFAQASNLEKPSDRLEGVTILMVAFDGNICGYGLACFVHFLNESLDSYDNVCNAVSGGMPYLINAYQASFAYAQRFIENNPNDMYGYLCVFSIDAIPDGEMPSDEIFEFSEIAYRKWPKEERIEGFFVRRKDRLNKKNIVPKLFIQKMAEMVAKDKRQAFKDLIIQGRFLELRLIRPDFFSHEIDTILMEIARETYSICAYDYVWHWMRDMGRETAQKHLLMAEMTWFIGTNTMSKNTTHYDGTKGLHFFHVYRAAELEPENIEIQEKLLSLYEAGNESFDLHETKVLVERVLHLKPESEQALRVEKILV
jgi:hypothetical protein